jgi:hypothetical protein
MSASIMGGDVCEINSFKIDNLHMKLRKAELLKREWKYLPEKQIFEKRTDPVGQLDRNETLNG